MSQGTHALIYRTKGWEDEVTSPYCVKLFKKGWMTPFNLELNAYECLLHADQVHKYIPHVYGYGERTLSQWGVPTELPNDKDLYYGIVMEWVENAEQLSTKNVTVGLASNLLTGLSKIHEAGVLHYDEYPRNMLVVPEIKRSLWIDFSCARMNEDKYLAQEMDIAARIILDKVNVLDIQPS